MPARTGEQYLKGLRTPRDIWVGSDKVSDVVDHPSFTGAAHALAGIFDLQHQRADVCLMPDPETGEPINVSHIIPRSRDDLFKRHACLETTAEYTVGLMGRTPDFLNLVFSSYAANFRSWAMHGNEQGAENIVNYQKLIRRNDLALTHALINPTNDRATSDNSQPGNDTHMRKVGETEHGIIVRGARVLATLSPFADDIACYPAWPLPEGAQEFAVAFSIPTNTPGLKFVCRDSVAGSRNIFDHPMSSRFDEQDALVLFDDVEVPWDRLFINGNLQVYNGGFRRTHGAASVMQQTMIRAQTKLEFAFGLAMRMVKAINANSPHVDEMLGEIWGYCELTRAAVRAAEMDAQEIDGAWFLAMAPMHALRCSMPSWVPRVNEIFRLIGAHNLLAAPTAAQFADPEIGPLLKHTLQGANHYDPVERSRLFRLAWDFVGSGLASRNEQYERFYLASGSRNRQMTSRVMGVSERADRLVDRFMTEDVPSLAAARAPAVAA